MMELRPTTLASDRVRLRPLALSDCEALIHVAEDGKLWEISATTVPAPEDMREYVSQALSNQARQRELPFAIVVENNRIVGTTRYREIDLANDRLEIGSTWIAASYHHTYVNTHAKFLLLKYAFETASCMAVEFRADVINTASRQALERVGAKLDGILRRHRKMRDGRIRDTAVYSIIAAEWPEVRDRFRRELDRA